MISAIVYTSNAGHTKRYAEMLADKTGLPVFELKAAGSKLEKGAQIVYLGWLMGGNVKGFKKAAKSFDVKAVCGVGMSASDGQIEYIRKANSFPEALPVFALRGGLEVGKLSGMYKMMMGVVQKAAKKGAENDRGKNPEADEMLELMLNGGDLVTEDDLSGIAEFIAEA